MKYLGEMVEIPLSAPSDFIYLCPNAFFGRNIYLNIPISEDWGEHFELNSPGAYSLAIIYSPGCFARSMVKRLGWKTASEAWYLTPQQAQQCLLCMDFGEETLKFEIHKAGLDCPSRAE